jgi:tetratricopeptide (TPR) repeat protein
LAALVYANALANGLVWDDPIVLDRQLRAFRTLSDLIFTPRNIPQYSPDYYRPLTTLTYLIDRLIGGSGPFMFHLSVVLFHVATTFLVFRFGLALGAGRSDVLACGFSVAAATAYLGDRWPPLRRAVVAAACVFLAMLAKETAAPLLFLVPATTLFVERRPGAAAGPAGRAQRRGRERGPAGSTSVLPYAPFAVAFLVYVALRQATIGSMLGSANPAVSNVPARLLAAVGLYVGKLLLPFNQSAYISDLPTGPLGLLTSALLVAAAIAACVLTWRSGQRRVTFLLLWTGLSLAPSLAIVLKIPSAPVAERYLYLPSVGFCLLAGYLTTRAAAAQGTGKTRAGMCVVVAALVAAGAWATVRRNAVWRTNLTLWHDTAVKNTTDGLPMRSLATTYQQLGDAVKATEYFQLALQRRNDQVGVFTIYNNLGSLAIVAKRLEEAERHYETALAMNPGSSECLFNLGLIALTRATEGESVRKHDQAQRGRQFFERAAQLSPLDPDIQVGLAQTLSALGDQPGARTHFERALQIGLPPATEASVRKLLAERK